MLQVNFTNRAITELNKLGKMEQLEIVDALSSVTPRRLIDDAAEFGRFERNGRRLYRLRVDEWRVYFEAEGTSLLVHYVLHKKTLGDFVVRFKLPVNDEQAIEDHKSFRDYLDSLMK